MSDARLTGGCLCGAVRYAVSGPSYLTGFCHCRSCRRASGAPAVVWATYAEGDFAVTEGAPAVFASSPGVARSFCARCGTPLAYRADFLPGLVDVTVGSLDDPAAEPPTMHYWCAERLAWLRFADALPEHPGFPPEPA
ncbi:MAG: GFA family protein [Alphaproteobacteria bacterium]